jgi:ATP-dependent Clp protease ATP-binding subunit ClpA
VFERFCQDARAAVAAARAEAIRAGREQIGCDHLLLGVLAGGGPGAEALTAAGVSLTGLRERLARGPAAPPDPLDSAALASVGIDLDAVRRAADATFGPGALDRVSPARGGRTARTGGVRVGKDTRKSLQCALVAARQLGQHGISSGHLLIGIIDQGTNPALDLLAGADVPPAALRSEVARRLSLAT